MILGDGEWQQAHRCWSPTSTIKNPCDSCDRGDAWCEQWPGLVRSRARSLAGDPRIWKLARRHQPECLTDEVVSFLEVRWALLKLREEDYDAWCCIEQTDMAYMGAFNRRTKERVERTARRLGVHPSTVYRKRSDAWVWVARVIVDTIAPDVGERVGR